MYPMYQCTKWGRRSSLGNTLCASKFVTTKNWRRNHLIVNIHRAGRLLDVAKSGYYNSDMCVDDFELVN